MIRVHPPRTLHCKPIRSAVAAHDMPVADRTELIMEQYAFPIEPTALGELVICFDDFYRQVPDTRALLMLYVFGQGKQMTMTPVELERSMLGRPCAIDPRMAAVYTDAGFTVTRMGLVTLEGEISVTFSVWKRGAGEGTEVMLL